MLLARNYTTRISSADWRVLRLTDYFPPAACWCLPAILLCRLEQGLLLVAIVVASLVIPAANKTERLRGIAIVLWPSVIVGIIYVLYNMITVGAPLPVSGMHKIGLAVLGNLKGVIHVMTDTVGTEWWFIAARLYPLIFGACAGIAIIGIAALPQWRRETVVEPERLKKTFYLYVFGSFIVMNVAFLFIFEPFYAQGYWYYWPLIMIPEILVAFELGFWTQKIDGLAPQS